MNIPLDDYTCLIVLFSIIFITFILGYIFALITLPAAYEDSHQWK